jgi:hypothetical protein
MTADDTELDPILPHPVYAKQSLLCVLNPGARSGEQLRDLLAHARARVAERAAS